MRENAERLPNERLCACRRSGGFEVYAGDVPVHFKRSKSKELFAFLVDRRGAGASNVQIARALWDNVYYDVSHQKMLQTIIADMMKALREVGAEQTVVRRRNHLSVRSSMIECDYYPAARRRFRLEGRAFGTVSSGLRMGRRKPLRRWSVRAEFGRMRATVDGSRGILWYRMCRRTTAIGEDVRC